MAEPDDYLASVARSERERRLADDRRHRAKVLEDARRLRDRVYDANKHMSILCATAVGFVVALGRLSTTESGVVFGLFAFGVPLVLSLFGLQVATLASEKLEEGSRDQATTVAGGIFIVATVLFTISVLLVLILPSATGTLGGLQEILRHDPHIHQCERATKIVSIDFRE